MFSKPRGSISKKTPAVLVIAVRSVKLTKFHSISSAVLLNSCHVPFASAVNEHPSPEYMLCIPFESILSARIVHVTGLCTRASDSVEISRTNSRYAVNVDFTCTHLKSSFHVCMLLCITPYPANVENMVSS